MFRSQNACWCEALKLVPATWRADFCRFVEEGEAGEPFLAFLEQDPGCRRACEMMLRADRVTAQVLTAAAASSSGGMGQARTAASVAPRPQPAE